jgi:hypothetical protein
MPRPLYPGGKSPRYPLDRRQGGPQSRSGREENSWPYRDSNSDPSVVQPVTSRYTDYPIPVPLKITFERPVTKHHTSNDICKIGKNTFATPKQEFTIHRCYVMNKNPALCNSKNEINDHTRL